MILTLTVPEPDPFDREFAEDYVHVSRDLASGEVDSIYVEQFDDPHLSRSNARAVGLRLLALADEWDRVEARPMLRRLPDVDERLRNRDV
ncbi:MULTISPECIES: hypothetical protein [Microbacterium]|uniref:hypothetical protein n=1 Tax=Microbacterium TaxID=33882 RepID=UPI00277E2F0B|nr:MULTISPECIES: hypothetical protein [Microbacterium]MDQ1084188.1 hypothetical protein [Microbacterium sp. SORGH_AS_0344]MDQ1170537.1 hypothetical protein [Microbacterium proteolyticum]